MTKRQNRMILVTLLVFGVSLAGYFGIKAFNENLLYFFTPTDVSEGKSPLCGNSVHQDRRFLRSEMPQLDSYFHYRIIDVSSVKELAKRWYDKEATFPLKPKKHLALDDIRESIKELEWYKEKIFKNTVRGR